MAALGHDVRSRFTGSRGERGGENAFLVRKTEQEMFALEEAAENPTLTRCVEATCSPSKKSPKLPPPCESRRFSTRAISTTAARGVPFGVARDATAVSASELRRGSPRCDPSTAAAGAASVAPGRRQRKTHAQRPDAVRSGRSSREMTASLAAVRGRARRVRWRSRFARHRSLGSSCSSLQSRKGMAQSVPSSLSSEQSRRAVTHGKRRNHSKEALPSAETMHSELSRRVAARVEGITSRRQARDSAQIDVFDGLERSTAHRASGRARPRRRAHTVPSVARRHGDRPRHGQHGLEGLAAVVAAQQPLGGDAVATLSSHETQVRVVGSTASRKTRSSEASSSMGVPSKVRPASRK